MRAALVVPRRADGGERDRLWAFCRTYWERELGWPVVEGHHDDGPFNRSSAVNRAVAATGADVLVILDGDVVLDADQVRAAVVEAHASGRLVLPFRRRMLVDAAGTQAILDGHQGSWRPWAKPDRNARHVSSCVVVRRDLFDVVRGFDERFAGWGGEDDAFHAACAAMAGAVRLDGEVWHLHHAPSPWRDWRSGMYRQARLLAGRYTSASPEELARLLDEDRGAEQVVVVALTNGRRDTLATALHSADQMLRGPVGRKVVVADGCTPDVPGGWDVVRVRGGTYTRAMQLAQDVAIGSGQPWVFWLEDDFVLDQPVDLTAMQSLMDANPQMAQLSLLRQPWYENELAAGGIIEAKPGAFTQREGWVEHRDYWTQNPMLTRRSFLAGHPWPAGSGSERRFGQALFRGEPDTVCGIFGRIGEAPRVTHIGVERAGRGY